jgi:hypothetical protein
MEMSQGNSLYLKQRKHLFFLQKQKTGGQKWSGALVPVGGERCGGNGVGGWI